MTQWSEKFVLIGFVQYQKFNTKDEEEVAEKDIMLKFRLRRKK